MERLDTPRRPGRRSWFWPRTTPSLTFFLAWMALMLLLIVSLSFTQKSPRESEKATSLSVSLKPIVVGQETHIFDDLYSRKSSHTSKTDCPDGPTRSGRI